MSKPKENNYICGTCKYYNSDTMCCGIHIECGEVNEQDTCDEWADDNEPTEEDLEAQKTDSAERENHRREVEGDDLL